MLIYQLIQLYTVFLPSGPYFLSHVYDLTSWFGKMVVRVSPKEDNTVSRIITHLFYQIARQKLC